MANEPTASVTPTGVRLRQSPAPKTIKVKSEDHDGQTITINEKDFDEEKHERVDAKPGRAKIVPTADDAGKAKAK